MPLYDNKIKEVIIMTERIKNSLPCVAGIIELGCLLGLAGIALKRNNDCYKAECKLIDAIIDGGCAKIDCGIKDLEIKILKKELDELKKENVEEEES
jgi:hypothetical protein